MSERVTAIHLPGAGFPSQGNSWAEWGRKTTAEMVAIMKARAQDDLATAKAILEAPDEAFHVQTYVGPHVQRNREVLQEGRPAGQPAGDVG